MLGVTRRSLAVRSNPPCWWCNQYHWWRTESGCLAFKNLPENHPVVFKVVAVPLGMAMIVFTPFYMLFLLGRWICRKVRV